MVFGGGEVKRLCKAVAFILLTEKLKELRAFEEAYSHFYKNQTGLAD